MSSTGDIKNNLSKLLRELKRMELKVEPNIRGLLLGIPSAFLPILHAALMSYSLPLAQHLSSLGVGMYGRSDLRFVEGLYKVMRDVFDYRPKISKDQFLLVGFAECKVILTFDLMKRCQTKHMELSGVTRPLSVRPSNKLSYSKLKQSKATPTTSSATVHTVASSQGIGTVWLEKPSMRLSTRLPLSPPASPLQSPSASEGPTITPEPRLELTPDSTPLKNNKSFSLFKLVPDHTSQSMDKDIHISELGTECDVEIVTVQSEENMDWFSESGNREWDGDSVLQKPPKSLISMPDLDCINDRVEDLLKMMDRLMGRMALVETQVKILQDRGVVSSKAPRVMQDMGTQTTSHIEEAPLARDISVGTSPIRDTPLPSTDGGPQLPSTGPFRHPSSPLHLPSIKSPPTNSTPLLSLQRRINFDTPNKGDTTPSLTRTPEETKKILDNLRTRAQQTKELLSRANHTSTTDSLLHPVN